MVGVALRLWEERRAGRGSAVAGVAAGVVAWPQIREYRRRAAWPVVTEEQWAALRRRKEKARQPAWWWLRFGEGGGQDRLVSAIWGFFVSAIW